MTIREYFYNDKMTVEEFEAKMEEENDLWNALEMLDEEEAGEMFEQWCIEHDVDIDAEEKGIKVVTLWMWDMCGD